MKKKRIAFRGSAYNSHYLWTHPWEIVDHYWRQLKYFIQRGLYGYADEDWWSIDYYLSGWMPTAIRQYKKGMGHPGSLKTMNDWKKILETMARGFEAEKAIQDCVWFHPKKTKKDNDNRFKKLEKEYNDGMKLFIKYLPNLWD